MASDYYSVLGVEPDADSGMIRQKYMELIRENHPDRFTDPDEKAKAENMFQDITEAYNVLRDPEARKAYDTERGKSDGTRGREKAESYFKKASAAVDMEKYHEAVQLLNEAIKIKGDDAKFYHLLAVAQNANPKWRKKAEKNCLKAIALDKFNSKYYVSLAKIYRDAGLNTRAVKTAEEGLSIDPYSEESRALLDELKSGGDDKSLFSIFKKD